MGVFIVFPIHWLSWQVQITINQKDCDKCFQRVNVNGKTIISLRDCIAYLIDSSQISFIISSVKNFSNNETGGSTVFSTGSGRDDSKPVESEISE